MAISPEGIRIRLREGGHIEPWIVDIPCIRAPLRLTPTERLRVHDQAVNFISELVSLGILTEDDIRESRITITPPNYCQD